MINWLLLVSDDGKPDVTIGYDDNFQNLLEKMPTKEILNMGIIIGIIIGVLIGIFLCLILATVVYFLQKENNENDESNTENKAIPDQNTDSKIIKYISYLLVVAMVIGTIAAITNVDSYLNSDYSEENNENTSGSKTRYATLDDIYTKITTVSNKNRTISIQASEKIKGLIIEVRFIDKDGGILETQEIDIGNISPGNEFTYKLNVDELETSKINKIDSFRIRVTGGTIEEE